MLWSSKINKFRSLALLLILVGMLVMNIALVGIVYMGPIASIIGYILMTIGFIMIGGSMFIYFYIGMLSTNAEQVVCPKCEKVTKMLGMTDHCMHCKTKLTLDPAFAPENRKSAELNIEVQK